MEVLAQIRKSVRDGTVTVSDDGLVTLAGVTYPGDAETGWRASRAGAAPHYSLAQVALFATLGRDPAGLAKRCRKLGVRAVDLRDRRGLTAYIETGKDETGALDRDFAVTHPIAAVAGQKSLHGQQQQGQREPQLSAGEQQQTGLKEQEQANGQVRAGHPDAAAMDVSDPSGSRKRALAASAPLTLRDALKRERRVRPRDEDLLAPAPASLAGVLAVAKELGERSERARRLAAEQAEGEKRARALHGRGEQEKLNPSFAKRGQRFLVKGDEAMTERFQGDLEGIEPAGTFSAKTQSAVKKAGVDRGGAPPPPMTSSSSNAHGAPSGGAGGRGGAGPSQGRSIDAARIASEIMARGAAGAKGPARGAERSGPIEPIIVVPSALGAIINSHNAKAFLHDQRYVKAGSDAGSRKEMRFTRVRPDRAPLTYRLVEDPKKIAPEDWDLVVAVVVQGKKWQFKNWKWAEIVDILSNVLGIHIRFDDTPIDPLVKSWNIRDITISRVQRHLDPVAARRFWEYVDDAVDRKFPNMSK